MLNAPDNILTVSALTQYIKRKFDGDMYLQEVTLVGEISNFNPKSTKHRYFSLKDDDAKINAVMFQSAFNKLKFQPQEGMKVIVQGRVSVYMPSGSYQITITAMQPDGIGALYQAYEQLKEKLQLEGAFEHKRASLSKYPKNIAVITSPSGAVIRDILTTIRRRYPIVQVVLFPVQVQGKQSAPDIVQAFERLERSSIDFDTVILARGGGSIEDLWSFNEEVVARAILSCPIPVISSVGHETDVTISDFVADVRAATPTAAAELAVPVMADLKHQVHQQTYRLHFALMQRLNILKKRLLQQKQSYVLRYPERLYQVYAQKLDDLNRQLVREQDLMIQKKSQTFSHLFQQLKFLSPGQTIFKEQERLRQVENKLTYMMRIYLDQQKHRFTQNVSMLNALSPLAIMERGFGLVEHQHTYIQSVNQVSIDSQIDIHLLNGTIRAQVVDIQAKNMEEEFNG